MPVSSNTSSRKEPLIGAIIEGTEEARFVVYKAEDTDEIVSSSVRITQICPREGWLEHDPMELLQAVRQCISCGLEDLERLNYGIEDIVAIGISNQRETTIAWDSSTGEPLYNAIVWSDIRADSTVDQILNKVPENNKNALMTLCGLPISPYFSALKMRWLIDNVPSVRRAIREQRCRFGTVDSWLVWNLTGGVRGGLFITDVTNASRTMLMNIESLQWDPVLCRYFNISSHLLPEIRSSSEIYGYITEEPLKGIPISAILGNQQSSLVGERCFKEGQAKSTYRKGCFLVYNTGSSRVHSTHGLETTVAYKMGKNAPAMYALEGSVAVAGSAMKWLKNNLNVVKEVSDLETAAADVPSTGDVYFVPAFSGLYAPYWRKDARGIICGLTQFTTKNHIIRAALEAVCFQTRDILEAMAKDCGHHLTKLQVDGKMTENRLLMQLQADLCGIPVERTCTSVRMEALGVAMAAGQAEGINVWDLEKEPETPVTHDAFIPSTNHEERDARYSKWKMAVKRSLGWATTKKSLAMTDERYRLLSSIPPSWFLISSFGILVISGEFER
ncbi:glycerol kinase 3 isoform X2 [Periplaneta americana]